MKGTIMLCTWQIFAAVIVTNLLPRVAYCKHNLDQRWIYCAGEPTDCPERCTCLPYHDDHDDGVTVRCRNLTGIANMVLAPNTVELIIVKSMLDFIPEDAIANCSKLVTLQLMFNEIHDIHPTAFRLLYTLVSFHLSWQTIPLSNVSAIIAGLPMENTALENVHLNRLYVPGEPLQVLENSFFTPFSRFPIRSLELSRCRISYIWPGFASNLKSVEVLTINNNLLDLYSTGLLQEIFLLPNLRTFAANIQGAYVRKKQRLSSYAAPRRSSIVHKSNVPMEVALPKTLEIVQLAFTLAVASTFPAMTFVGSENLWLADFQHNSVSHIDGPIKFPDCKRKGMLTLKLTANHVIINTTDAFDDSIGTLILRENSLGEVLNNDTHGLLFRNASNLIHLNLRNNGIVTFADNVLIHQTHLRTLILSNNYLRDVNFKISHMTELEMLDLDYNQLTVLEDDFTSALDKLIQSRPVKNLTVSIKSNEILCVCDTLNFLYWLISTDVIVRLPPTCISNTGRITLSIHTLKTKIIPEVELICNTHSIIILTSLSLSFSIVFVLLSICIYRQRWDIKFFCLKFIRERKRFMEQNDDHLYEFDAFVAYHKEDLSFVREQLIPYMEEIPSQSFKFCIHQRDFMPGTPIQENIVDTITNSRKVILVITSSFAKSPWCEFETHLAWTRCMDEGRDVIIPILLEELQTGDMTKTMAKLLSKNTYIEWPNSSAERAHFWEKLREALSTNIPANTQFVRCDCGKTIEI